VNATGPRPDGSPAGGAGAGPSAAERLQAIYDRARASFTENLDTIDTAVEHLAGDVLDEEERHAAERAAHRVAGAAGTVGFPQATAPARQLEDAFAEGPRPGDVAVLRGQAAALRQVLAGAAATDDE
jgi:HPt (histidine-containing phosphotransfer) domain-containing protein